MYTLISLFIVDVRGLNGNVTLDGVSVTDSHWEHRTGLKGEAIEFPQDMSASAFMETVGCPAQGATGQLRTPPLTWVEFTFVLPEGFTSFDDSAAYALDLSTMGKGAAWVNGEMIGEC